MAAAGRVCASRITGRLPVEANDRLGLDMLALADLLDAPLGRYRVLDVVGGGGMGLVLAAWDEQLERRVAIKALRHFESCVEAAPAIRREATALAALSDPGVVEVFDVVERAGRAYIVMELVEGTTLRAWQATRGAEEIVEAYVAVGRGLAAVHAQGIVHCDVKPDNVLVSDDGRFLLADFGFAVLADRSMQAHEPTGGTPRYMAPEQKHGGAVTPAADQYAWCVSLWEALTGQSPPREAGAIAPRVRRALERGLSKNVEARFPAMLALVRALRPRRARWRTLGVAATAAAFVGGAAWVGLPAPATAMLRPPSVSAPEHAGPSAAARRVVARAVAEAAAARAQGDLRTAEKILGKALQSPELDPESRARLLLRQARALDRMGERDGAIALLVRAEDGTADAPPALRARVELELVRQGAGRVDEAPQPWLEAARASLRRAGIDPDTHVPFLHVKADLLQREGRHDDAHETYVAAVALLDDALPAIDRVELLIDHASNLGKLGRNDEAVTVLDRAAPVVDDAGLGRSDAAARVATTRAMRRAESGHRPEAIEELKTAIEAAERVDGLDERVLGVALNSLGAYLNLEHRAAESFAALKRAEALIPDFYGVHANLAMHYSRLPCQDVSDQAACHDESRAKALAHTIKAYEQARVQLGADHPSVAQLAGNLAHDHLQRGQLDLARKYVQIGLPGLIDAYGPTHALTVRPRLSALELHVRTKETSAALDEAADIRRAVDANKEALGPAAVMVVGYVLARTRIWAGEPLPGDRDTIADALAALGPRPPDDIRMIDAWFSDVPAPEATRPAIAPAEL